MTYRSDKIIVDHNPEIVFVESTNICNLRCVMCPITKMTRPDGYMNISSFMKICDEMAEKFGVGTRLNFYFFGEPFMHPKATEMIAYAKSLGLRMEFSTNLLLLNEERIHLWLEVLDERDTIVLSLDAYNKEDYERIRVGGTYERLLENYRLLIREYSKWGDTRPLIQPMCHYDWDPYRTRLNHPIAGGAGMEQVKDFVRTFVGEAWDVLGHPYTDEKVEELAALIVEKSKEGTVREYIDDRICLWIRRLVNFAQQIGDERFFKAKGQTQRVCDYPWRSLIVLWNGDVVVCCFDVNGTQNVGNAFENNLSEIWNGAKIQQLRRDFIDFKNEGLCEYCE